MLWIAPASIQAGSRPFSASSFDSMPALDAGADQFAEDRSRRVCERNMWGVGIQMAPTSQVQWPCPGFGLR